MIGFLKRACLTPVAVLLFAIWFVGCALLFFLTPLMLLAWWLATGRILDEFMLIDPWFNVGEWATRKLAGGGSGNHRQG